MKKIIYAAMLAMLTSLFSARTLNLYAEEKEYKPSLVLYEEYCKEKLRNVYYMQTGKEYDPKDTTFFYNPYSVMLDTNWGKFAAAGTPIDATWIKNYFIVRFDWNVIPRKEIYEDNRLIYYTIDDILPQYEKTIQGFKKLEEKWGKFRFVDTYSAYPDTTHYWVETDTIKYDRELWIEFDNYVPAFDPYNYQDYSNIGLGNVFGDLRKIELVNYVWYNITMSGYFFNDNDNVISEQLEFMYLKIFPNIASDQITLYLPETLTIFPNVIKIIDIAGNVVKLFYTGIDTQQTINILGLQSGHYYVQIGDYLGKFIVKK